MMGQEGLGRKDLERVFDFFVCLFLVNSFLSFSVHSRRSQILNGTLQIGRLKGHLRHQNTQSLSPTIQRPT